MISSLVYSGPRYTKLSNEILEFGLLYLFHQYKAAPSELPLSLAAGCINNLLT